MIIILHAAAAIIGYLLGSIPFGLLIAKLVTNKDVRQTGSGKTGATNVLRTAGKAAALLVLILDLLKGVLAVLSAWLIFYWAYPSADASLATETLPGLRALAALAAIFGHNWPVFVRFRGGRGVATFFGGLLVLNPLVGVSAGLLLFAIAGFTRYASLASISGLVASCLILLVLTVMKLTPTAYLIYAILGAILIIIMHRGNIKRLLAGKERKLGEKVKD